MKTKVVVPLVLLVGACGWCVTGYSADSPSGEDDSSGSAGGGAAGGQTKSTEAPVNKREPAIPVYGGGGAEEPPDEPNENLPPVVNNGKAPELAGYTKWKVVNEKPQYINFTISAGCAGGFAPRPQPKAPAKASPAKSSPTIPVQPLWHHPSTEGKYIRVLVNDKGKNAMFAKKPQFPVGSIIIKQKLPSATSTTPELLTVMIKRAAGYNPQKGDWEYLVTDGSGQKAYDRGRLSECQSCHVEQSETDYVFRSYTKLQ